MKSVVRAILNELGWLDFVRRPTWHIRRNVGRIDEKLVAAYLAGHSPRKLQIGSGFNVLDTWLNSDYDPASEKVLFLDATARFPLPSESFDYVFSEHMIEHITYQSGSMMLAECHRILKPGGKIRISTPNLKFLVDLYNQEKTELQIAYIKWSIENFIGWATSETDAFVINNYVRDWGHQFIYDEKTLRTLLEKSGFVNSERYEPGKSSTSALAGLENLERMPAGFLKLETLTIEASKPKE
jgi:predicted SAM-dependent methyltransferase